MLLGFDLRSVFLEIHDVVEWAIVWCTSMPHVDSFALGIYICHCMVVDKVYWLKYVRDT